MSKQAEREHSMPLHLQRGSQSFAGKYNVAVLTKGFFSKYSQFPKSLQISMKLKDKSVHLIASYLLVLMLSKSFANSICYPLSPHQYTIKYGQHPSPSAKHLDHGCID
ncbi:UNVERIFIED_CONTAM: hypothetical protein K2H54_070328 [Gekko kuhli]